MRTTEPWQRWSGGGQQPGSRGQESEQPTPTHHRAQVWTPGHDMSYTVIHCHAVIHPVIHGGMPCHTLHSWRRCPARPDADIRPEAILSTSFGSSRTDTHHQVTCTCQIWISGWILPHFDVRTISVASKLKKLQIFLYY